jgi:hypothetical protein
LHNLPQDTPFQAPHTIAITCLLTYQVQLGPF